MDKVETFISKHLAWIASIVIAMGFYIAVIQVQGANIDALKCELKEQHSQISQLEKCVTKLISIEESITEMKSDIKSIKSILYKPVIAYEPPTNQIAVR